jgi:hypothetical protein
MTGLQQLPAKEPRADRHAIDHIVLLLGATSYLYINLFAGLHTPYLLGGDQVFFWMDAQRMLGGERVYRDFYQFTPPGTDLVYLALFKLFGPHLWVTNATVLVLGVVLCWVCFIVASEIMDRASALLATFLFLVLIYGKLLNGTHHWFSVLAVVCAVKISMKNSKPVPMLITGGLLGVASFFTQTRGAMALLAVVAFLAWEQVRTKKFAPQRQLLLLLGFSVALLILSAPWIFSVGFRQLWFFQVTYVTQYVLGSLDNRSMGLPAPLGWHSLPNLSQYLAIYILLPVVYSIALWRCWRERQNPLFLWRQVALLSMVGLFLMLEVASNLNWLRIYTVSMPGIILFVWILARSGKLRRSTFAMIWCGAICLGLWQTASRHRHAMVIAQLPGGRAAVDPKAYDKLHWIMQHTRPGQFFFQTGWPGVYLPLALRNPVYVEDVGPSNGARAENIASTIRLLDEKRVQYIMWTEALDSQDGLAGRPTDNLRPLRAYVRGRYDQVQVFADGDSIWRKKE